VTRPRVLIIGAGFAGFHCARQLERKLEGHEAEVALVTPRNYLALPRPATQARVGAEWLLHALAGGGELIRLGFLAQRTGTLADFEHTDAGLNQEETRAALTTAGET
jgi:NADH dehydrogenase